MISKIAKIFHREEKQKAETINQNQKREDIFGGRKMEKETDKKIGRENRKRYIEKEI